MWYILTGIYKGCQVVDKNELLERYADNLVNSRNKEHYLSYARSFLEQSDGINRASVDRYMDSLRTQGRSPGTINFAFRVLRRLFVVNGLPWEYRRGEAPAISERDEYRPQLSTDIIEVMVSTAKSGRLYPDESCFLALSTTYGLRREELVNLVPEDVDLSNGSIFIGTIKMGRQRYHKIPPEIIIPYLENHDFSRVYGLSTMSQMFKKILDKSGLGALKSQRLGWHTIRRALLDGLVNNGVNILAARSFLRWKSATGDMAMPARYYGNVVIGLEGSSPVLEEAKGDEEIFELHPFLGFWSSNDD
jgi:integrase